MTNDNIKSYLLNEYTRAAYTSNYIFGYVSGGVVYAARVNDADALLPYISYVDVQSTKNGGTLAVKYRPSAAKFAIIAAAAEEVRPVCSVEYMESIRAAATGLEKNRGYIFEHLCAKLWDAELTPKSNEKFTNAGDMTINGVPYQSKFPRATFTDEKTIQGLYK